MPSVIIGKVKGDKGEAGISPIVTLEKNENLLSISVTDAEGTKIESIDTSEAVQSDWNTTDTALNSYIKNKPEIPSKVSQLKNDSGYLTSYTETDPTVPAWAKSATKPEYTATEVGALPSDTTHVSGDVPITRKINGKILNADITLSANDVGALSNTTTIPNSLSDFGVTATADEVNVLDGITVTTSELNYVDGVVSNIQTQLDAKSPSTHNHDERYYTENEIDTKISNINDSISSHTESTSNPHNVTKSQVGLGNVNNTSDINKPVSTAQQTAIDTAYENSNAYTDQKIADLINGAPTTLDTLGEIATAMQEHEEVVSALNDAIGSKANQSELDTHTGNSTIHITASERTNWNSAKTHADSAHAPSNAQANVIETVKVNGTALTPSSKAVNVTVPTKVSDLTNDSGYTTNTGTITGIKMNGTSKGTSGVVDLGTVITSHQDISGKSDVGHKHTKSEITDFPTSMTPTAHNQSSNTINAMTGYSKPSSTSAITTSDSLNSAIGKLEKALDGKGTSNLTIGTTSTTAAAGNHTHSSYVNQNAFSNVTVGSTTVSADSITDTLTLVAGSNVTITPDATNDKITIAATDTKYSHPTYTAKDSGLYKVTIDGTGHVSTVAAVTKSDITALGIPGSDTNTHYASGTVVNNSTTATSNTTSALTNGNVYLNHIENGAVKNSHKISGSGATTVTSDASGNIVISSTDNNTTYSAGTGLSLSGTTFSNSGVRSIVSGSTNGTISVNTNGTSAEVAVKGLGSAAYTESSAYLSSSGGTVKGTLTIDKSGTSSSTPILSLGNSSGKVMTYIYLSSGHPQVAGVWEATNLYEGGKSLADKYQTKVHEVISSSEPTSQVSGDYWLEDY